MHQVQSAAECGYVNVLDSFTNLTFTVSSIKMTFVMGVLFALNIQLFVVALILGRDGLTHNMLDNIHAHWKRRRVCKIKCKGVCTVDMDNVCEQLEVGFFTVQFQFPCFVTCLFSLGYLLQFIL